MMSQRINPYGDGRAAPRIVDALLGEQVEESAPGRRHDERLRHRALRPARPAARFPLAWGRSPAEPQRASERSTLRSERP